MIQDFVEEYMDREHILRRAFEGNEKHKDLDYIDLVKLIFDIVLNPQLEKLGMDTYDTEHILKIDDGDYQGTLLFLLHKGNYQPSVEDYVYTSVSYGSCSGCDTLQAIQCDYNFDENGEEIKTPDNQQIDDYMKLCLHILQNCNYMKDR